MTPRAIAVALVLVACSSGNVKVPHPDLSSAPADMSVAAPTKLAPASTLTNCLAADSNYVYWSDQGSGPQILKVSLGGGTPSVVAAGGDKPGCVAVDGSGVYYTDNGALVKVPLGGGPGYPLASGQHFLKGAPLVASAAGAGANNLFWITDVYGNVDAYNGKNAIVDISDTGGNLSIVSATVNGSPGGFAVDGTSLYWSDYSGTFALPLANPMATPISFGTGLHESSFAVGNGHLAQAESTAPGSGSVVLYRSDGMMRTVLSSKVARPLAVDGSGAYVNDSGALVRLALDGSGATLLATQPPRALVLTATAVVFTDGTAIYSVPR